VEPKTVFGHLFAKRAFTPVPDEINALQYEMAIDQLTAAGYEHYEVSNFGKPGFLSAHNSSYWQGKKYAGFGPGAHSYDGHSRSFNVRNNAAYLRKIALGKLPIETEALTPLDELNEYILTRSRTKWGLDLAYIQTKWGLDILTHHEKFVSDLVDSRKAIIENGIFRLTSRGFSLADEIALHFFSVE
jgi:oxygen-independent coproporphyrinogen-3 oxidase